MAKLAICILVFALFAVSKMLKVLAHRCRTYFQR